MAYGSFSTSNYLRASSTPITAYPLTIAAWAKTTDLVTAQILCSIKNGASASLRNNFDIRVNSSGVPVCQAGDASSSSNASAPSGLSSNTWAHIAGRFTDATHRDCAKDGSFGSESTTSLTPSGIDGVNIGAQYYSSGSLNFPWGNGGTGEIAELGVWNVALTDAEVLSLAAGFSPRLVRPQSLVIYMPLVRDVIDLKGRAFSVVGSPAVSSHHRIFA